MKKLIKSDIELLRTDHGDVLIALAEPAFVSADAIIIDRSDSSVHAVLHGAAHFVGHVSALDVAMLTHKQPITLTAPHYFRGAVNMRSVVSLN